jgi:hypothetical protein
LIKYKSRIIAVAVAVAVVCVPVTVATVFIFCFCMVWYGMVWYGVAFAFALLYIWCDNRRFHFISLSSVL